MRPSLNLKKNKKSVRLSAGARTAREASIRSAKLGRLEPDLKSNRRKKMD